MDCSKPSPHAPEKELIMSKTKKTLIIVGVFLSVLDLYGGYRLHKMLLAILQLPILGLCIALRWRAASDGDSK